MKIHWSFGFLLLYLFYTVVDQGVSTEQALWFGGYFIALFGCVVLHEYGHALAARRYGVNTRDIILSPIGGVARLERLPEKPKEELVIALAGPAVNLAITIIVGVCLYFIPMEDIEDIDFSLLNIHNGTQFIIFLGGLNAVLFLFNLIPAFPMDGGRVLRALLAMKWGRVRATQIASILGRVLAVAFIILGFYNAQYIWVLIGGFVFATAAAEYQYAKMKFKLEEFSISDLMRTEFTKIHIGDKYKVVIDHYQKGVEFNFLVFDSIGYVSGSVPEAFIKHMMNTEGGAEKYISNTMSRKFKSVDISTLLEELVTDMNTNGIAIVAVLKDEEIVGVLDRKDIASVFES